MRTAKYIVLSTSQARYMHGTLNIFSYHTVLITIFEFSITRKSTVDIITHQYYDIEPMCIDIIKLVNTTIWIEDMANKVPEINTFINKKERPGSSIAAKRNWTTVGKITT